jgi:hypothetical protein
MRQRIVFVVVFLGAMLLMVLITFSRRNAGRHGNVWLKESLVGVKDSLSYRTSPLHASCALDT